MSKEIILIKELTRISDLGQSFVQYRDNSSPPAISMYDEFRVENEHYEAQNCQVKFFCQMKDGVTKRIRFAFSPEVEKEFEIIFEVINDQNQSIADLSATVRRLEKENGKLRWDKFVLQTRLNNVKSMSIWQRVKFVFSGSAAW